MTTIVQDPTIIPPVTGEKECKSCTSEYCSDRDLDLGRKIRDGIENPFSCLLLKVNDPLIRPMANKRISANMLTTASLITGLLAIYFIWNKKPILGGILYVVSYFFDCSDGCMARFTRTESRGGDLYDHWKDCIVFILLLIVVQIRYPIPKTWLALFISLFTVSLVHFGSCERYNELACGQNLPHNVLGLCKRFSRVVAPTDDCDKLVRTMKVSRFFSDGSLVFAIMVYLVTRQNPDVETIDSFDPTV